MIAEIDLVSKICLIKILARILKAGDIKNKIVLRKNYNQFKMTWLKI